MLAQAAGSAVVFLLNVQGESLRLAASAYCKDAIILENAAMKNPYSFARNTPVSPRDRTGLKKTVGMLAGAVFLSTALAACTMPITVLFANHTAHSVTVFYLDGRDRPASLVVAPGAATRIDHLMSRDFSLQTRESTLFYERAFPPGSYVEYLGFGPFKKRVVKAQLENDGYAISLLHAPAIVKALELNLWRH